MSEPTSDPQGVSPLEQFEQALDRAKAPAWAECPAWLKTAVSPLVRFISSEDLQRDIAAPDAEARFIAEHIEDQVSDEYIETLRLAAHKLIENYQRRESGTVQDDNAYHNADHDRQVVDRVARLLKISHPRVSTQAAEAVIMAATFHDVQHPGGPAKLRVDDGLSYEQYSQTVADAEALNPDSVKQVIGTEKEFTLEQRAILASAIIGTTFGDPMVKPFTQIERIMKLADIGGYMESREEWIEQSIEVADEYANLDNYNEDDLPPPFVVAWLVKPDLDAAMAEWLQGQTNFIAYELLKPHQEFQQLHMDPDDQSAQAEWRRMNESLQEKVTMVETLKVDSTTPAYRDIATNIRGSLQEIIGRDRERVIERIRQLKTSGTLDPMYTKAVAELGL